MSALQAPGSVTDTVTEPGWTCVRVEARFAEPVIGLPKDPMHLDGPLSWGAYQDAIATGDRATVRLPPMGEWAHDFILPLATWIGPCTHPAPDPRLLAADGTSMWGWTCSRAQYEVVQHTAAQVRRRPPVNQMARWTSAPRYHPALGPRRAANMNHQGVWIHGARWWALAEPARLQQLLGRVTHVGRLARQGWGRVLSWTVAEDPMATSLWRDRWFPAVGGPLATVRAPYHHQSRRMPAQLNDVAA